MSQGQTALHLDELLKNCDAHIKAGKINTVADLISNLNLARVPRLFRQPLAKVCRRAGLIHHGLRILQPVIRHEKQLQEPATPGEICEYAVLLSRNGSIAEALVLLRAVDSSRAPEALLYESYCHISSWDCEAAARLLESYLSSASDSYSKLIARVNLASCYLATKELASAEHLLDETIELAREAGALRLVGNAYELRGQMHIQLANFKKAKSDLNEALSVFGQSGSYDQLLIYKWQSIMASIEKTSVRPLLEFRNEALRREHWESVREADLFTLKIQFDQPLFDQLIFGTPMKAYRERIRNELRHDPSSFFIIGKNGSRSLDLSQGEVHGRGRLNPGMKIHQVIQALTRDLYVPQNIGTLFSELYPDEYFDIESSPVRIHQLLQRTRRWIKENEIPVEIAQSRGSYKLSVTGAFGILVPLSRESIDPNSIKWAQIKKHFANEISFRSEDVCRHFGLSRAGFHRLATWAIDAEELQRTGAGKATSYRVVTRSTTAAKEAA